MLPSLTTVRVIIAALVGAAAAAGCSGSTSPPNPSKPAVRQARVVFSRLNRVNGFYADVFVASPDGTHVRRVPLAFPLDGGGGAVWSPDGTKLLLTNVSRTDATTGRVSYRPATVDADGSRFKLLLVPGAPIDMFCEAWSPDGTRLLCGIGGKKPGLLSIRASDGGEAMRLSTAPAGMHDVPGDYSPDGTQVLFTRIKPHRSHVVLDEIQAALFVTNANGGGQPHQITPYGAVNPHDYGAVAHWSPNGRDIVYATPPSTHGLIHIIHVDGTDLRTIDPGSFPLAPDWSPNGKQIVFTMYVGQDTQIFTANVDGTNLTQLTNAPGQKNFADWRQ